MSEKWKRYDYIVMEKLTKDSEAQPKIVLEGKITSIPADVYINIARLPEMKDHPPETVEVSVNCPF